MRAVLGQQITVKAASTLAARLVAAYGTQVQTGIGGLTHSFPAPAAILALGENISGHLGKLGIISARANTIYQLARVLADEKNDFGFCGNPEEEMHSLIICSGRSNSKSLSLPNLYRISIDGSFVLPRYDAP